MGLDRAVVFLHVPKTAGSTLRQVLRRRFAPGEVWAPDVPGGGAGERPYLRYLRGEAGRTGLEPGNPNDRYLRTLAELPPDRVREMRLLLGHFWFGIHEALPIPSTYVTMLRDPVSRVLSLYAHRRAHHGIDRSLEHYLTERRDWEIDNGQTRRLAGRGHGGDVRFDPATDAMLDLAKRHLRDAVSVVGVTERFDDFVAMLGEEFGWRRLTYVSRNVSRERLREPDLSEDVLRTIRAHNELDVELYRHATGLIAERAASLDPPLEDRVRAIRRRSAVVRKVRPAAVRLRRVLPRRG
ncbi:MAG: sulfotransferase family 2 domain-containing protein [Actinomycetota bacterium]